MLSTCRRVGSASAVKTASAVVTSARCRCRGKIHAKLAKLALPTLGVALALDAPQLRRQTCKARLDHPQSRALGVVIEGEFDSGEWPFGGYETLPLTEGPFTRGEFPPEDRKSTRLNSRHTVNSYAVFS